MKNLTDFRKTLETGLGPRLIFNDRFNISLILAHLNDFYYPSSTIKSLPCPSQNRFACTVSQY